MFKKREKLYLSQVLSILIIKYAYEGVFFLIKNI